MDCSPFIRHFVLAAALVGAATGCEKSQPATQTPADPVDSATAPAPAAAPAYQPANAVNATGMVRIEDKAYFFTPTRWANPVVPVCWESSVPNGPERGWVKAAIDASWNAAGSRLKFVGFGTCAANAVGIRIDVRDLSAADGPHTRGLGNQLNAVPKGMVLNFTFQTWSQACAVDEPTRESCIRSIAVHEFGHAAGFAHEQNRPDTPGECTQPPQGGNGDVMLTPWDPKSVMNYCNPIYNNDGVLSDLDKRGLRDPRAYGVAP